MNRTVAILLASLMGVTQLFGGEPPFIQYTFDETSGNVARNSGTGGETINALTNGGDVRWMSGLFGGAAGFSNNGHFKLPDGALENITDFTLSTWVYINEQSDNQTVCTFANGTEQYLILTTQRGGGEGGVSLVMTKEDGGSSGNHVNKEERIYYTNQKEHLAAEAWHHLAFTLKDSVGTLYVDGVKAAVKTDFTTNPSRLGHTTNNYIGRPTWPDPFLNGMIDDFRIYGYSLTDDQILEMSAAADPVLVKNDRDKLSLGNLSAITSNLYLPSAGASGSHITWNTNNILLANSNGVIHRPDAGSGNREVTLTASIRKGTATLTKEFTATIKETDDPADLDVFAMQTGNPTVPAYLADASFYYDKNTDTFYAYGTNDGAGGGNVYPTQVWYSQDCKTWTNSIVVFPKSWTDYAGTVSVWAPSIAYSPVTKKYYLMYSIASNTFIGMASHPLGPWEDANGTSPGNMFYKGYDGQFFVDGDSTIYIVTDAHHFKIMKMKADAAGKLYFDNDDPRFSQSSSNQFAGTYRYAQITEIRNSFEASYIYKINGLYYLMWSFNGSENYNVRYAVSEKLTGPYREIAKSMTEPILVRDDRNNILGPGHHSMFDYGGRTFIAYHRQHFPFVDSKRQTCIEEVHFNADGSIQKITPTHRGVTVREIKKDPRINIALGKQTMVSSVREYDGSAPSRRYRTYGFSFRYTGNFAVDENYGTRWDAGIDAQNPWLIVDLENNCTINQIETFFEFTSCTYRYMLEYLTGENSLAGASKSTGWKIFADRSTEGTKKSPVTDTAPAPVKARFVRLTILGASSLPRTADGLDPVNATNSMSIFEIKIFGKNTADSDINRTFEAENYHNRYGTTFGKTGSTGLTMINAQNNDFLLYKNIDFAKGASIFTAKVTADSGGSRFEIHLDSLTGKPAGVLEITSTDGNWKTETVKLKQTVKGRQNRIYLVFKGSSGGIDWFKFNHYSETGSVSE